MMHRENGKWLQQKNDSIQCLVTQETNIARRKQEEEEEERINEYAHR